MWKPTTMATRLLPSLLLLLAVSMVRGAAAAAAGGSPSWCVCRPDASDAALQSTLDYACGKGGVDCRPLHQGGQCHGPDTLLAHCSYAANSYFHKISRTNEHATCDFGGAATLSEIDPSSETCTYLANVAAPSRHDVAPASPPEASGAAAWCVCKPGLSNAALQGTLDYACGHGADCEALRPGGQCHVPNTLLAHCSYAANSYFQSNKDAACDFTGTAALTTTDPSSGTCNYPATDDAMSPAVGKMQLIFLLLLCLMGFSVYAVVLCVERGCSRRPVVSGRTAVQQEYGRAEVSGGAAVRQEYRRAAVSGGAAVEQETGTAAAAAAAEESPITDPCSVCLEAWTNLGPHRICCILCGHVFGRSCLETWLGQHGNSRAPCPKCKTSFRLKDIINLYVPEVSASRAVEPADTLPLQLAYVPGRAFVPQSQLRPASG